MGAGAIIGIISAVVILLIIIIIIILWASGVFSSHTSVTTSSSIIKPESTQESTPSPTSTPEPACGILQSNAKLFRGGEIYSCNGLHKLIYQPDGYVVLYSNGIGKWSTNPSGQGTGQFVMQSDGNLVLYDSDGNDRWHSVLLETMVRIYLSKMMVIS